MDSVCINRLATSQINHIRTDGLEGNVVIAVIAHYRTSPETLDQVRALLIHHAAQSENESGCLTFNVHQDLEDPTRFALYEVYTDHDAFEAHRETPHFQTNIEQTLAPMLIERCWQRFGSKLAAKRP